LEEAEAAALIAGKLLEFGPLRLFAAEGDGVARIIERTLGQLKFR
jgi:hypothetical protein